MKVGEAFERSSGDNKEGVVANLAVAEHLLSRSQFSEAYRHR